ncbi:MAG: 16S rRNA (cytidine(1402)-2'-O)-methyltransferase [Christensenellales bacterium]
MPGKLMLVSTPIGNLGDITLRAREALASADAVAAEDTRRTLQLLNHLGLKKPLVSFHAHSAAAGIGAIIRRIRAGETVAYVSDAGTPCISDPGAELVAAARREGVEMVSLPGPSAVLCALTLSGMDASRFLFEGFLPRGKAKRGERVRRMMDQPVTCVLYESPHRLKDTLRLIADADPERRVCCCRELTKLHEETLLCTAEELAGIYEEKDPRGEYVLVIEKAKPAAVQADAETRDALLTELLNSGTDKPSAARRAAAELGLSRRALYQRLLELEDE